MKSKKIVAAVFFIVIAFVIISSKGQFGRFSFWGTRSSGDSSAPTCSFNTQPTLTNGWINATTTPNFTFSCTDDVSVTRVECRLNSNVWVTCDSSTSHTITGLTNTAANNSDVFKIRAFDSSGNISAEVASAAFGVDLDPPTAPTASLSGTDSTPVTYTVSGGTDGGSSGVTGLYYYSYDTGTANYGTSLSGTTFSNNLTGTVYFRTHTTDNAGNTGADAVISWTNGVWSSWSACSAACSASGGTQTRNCDNPAPSTNPPGLACSGASSQSCNIGVDADNTANMCNGHKYHIQYSGSSCPNANPCPQQGPAASSTIIYCTEPITTASTCSGTTYTAQPSCVNSTVTAQQNLNCYNDGKSFYESYTCICQ